MQTLDLNLASRPFKNNTLLWIVYSLAVVILIAVSVRNVQGYRESREWFKELGTQVADVETRLADFERRDRQALREIAAHDLEVLTVRADKANEVIRWKAFSWTRLFNRLEAIQPYDVLMTSVHPIFRPEARSADPRRIEDWFGVPVSVDGIAKDLRAFLEFERALFRDPHFNRVEPQGTQVEENTKELVFSLRFFYDPDAVVEVAEATGPPVDDPALAAPDSGTEPVAEEAVPEEAAAEGEPETIPGTTEPDVDDGSGAEAQDEPAPQKPPAKKPRGRKRLGDKDGGGR